MDRKVYLDALDKALLFAAEHTDLEGRMIVNGEIDTKDSGWLVLGGVIRGVEAGWHIDNTDLKEYCRRWTLASVRVDDVKSAWTTFALLLCFEFTNGKFREFFTDSEFEELTCFFKQLDMHFLLEASRNYRVAAAVIDVLRVRYGFAEEFTVSPEECINYMLDGYLGEGFFNDDDGRGDNRDRRIDAYSAEIIGLLLHYDEICSWNSFCHDRIQQIVSDFCEHNLKLVDANGEYAKWGRSLRGEAEVKKIFLWEYAQKMNISDSGSSVAENLFAFFQKTGIEQNGKIGRDKAFDTGIWDEYTTCVQAQGYGIYGLAMALRFASGSGVCSALPSEKESFVVHLEKSGIICGNSHITGNHYIFPYQSRMTKNMFFWHNRITGENDVNVDVSAKFMPIPYFGYNFPAPYAGPVIPFLPLLRLADDTLLIPRNLDSDFCVRDNCVSRRFDFCKTAEYTSVCDLSFIGSISCHSESIDFKFDFSGKIPEDAKLEIYLFAGDGEQRLTADFKQQLLCEDEVMSTPSIYSSVSRGRKFVFNSDVIEYTIKF